MCFLGGVCNTYIKILFIFFEKECEHDELVVILEYYTWQNRNYHSWKNGLFRCANVEMFIFVYVSSPRWFVDVGKRRGCKRNARQRTIKLNWRW
jgi:hypothetical protein